MDQAETLIQQLRKSSAADIGKLMSISEALEKLNHARFQAWSAHPLPDQTRPAVYAFQGDVYQGMEAQNWTAAHRKYAQKNLRILSGLYGLLRPLDSLQPYRLEMGTKLKTKAGKNLYEFWGTRIRDSINQLAEAEKSEAIVNLASQEYARAAKLGQLSMPVVNPVFKDESNGKYKVISFFAKKARGRMADWIIRQKLTQPEQLSQFSEDGYEWQVSESTELSPVFYRPKQNQ
ncbi:UNVERIFIED_CONTAM: hypothetical protein GTU68_012848 [Idotea baltica]|nr:hypothetical protein [Idotea baltica]